MKWKQLLLVVAVSASSAVGSVWVYGKINKPKSALVVAADGKLPVNYAGFNENIAGAPADPIDFTKAASAAVPAVVHIKTKIAAKKISNSLRGGQGNSMDDFFDQFFFGPGGGNMIQPEQRASGSGVLLSEDGYIVTNNHVVSDGREGVAEEITVTLSNKKSYPAKVIGRDASTDLAVLKIDATGLPYMIYGNSDNVKLGQWVLAVGYPLTLETTVTAGIVSAKSRTIGINSRQSNSPVESFIQTDAAINQGNSGGALITPEGQLIGINSAILAPNGTYAGYGFAIPVNIVRKVVSDLIEFGDVKRGYLGISYTSSPSANESLVKQAGQKDGQGVYVQTAPADGAAAAAGLKKGDIITKVNGNSVSSGIEMSGHLASLKPGEKVPVTYLRSGKEYTANVTLKATASKLEDISATEIVGDRLGLELENLDSKKAKEYDITGGVVVKKIKDGGPFSGTRMEQGFIITTVNGQDIKNADELGRYLENGTGRIKLEGIYPGYNGTYTYQVKLDGDSDN
ncbi:MAG: trypsin-like peptidase domain-containing protein [Sphingobacteriales bacterium]|jgi:Do/DeqQ family serine protease|nr:trypsin-like peptidase domain-containing protein [Sphingobacteriales bacterium]OJW03303.1 MAG: serine protease [Sphingobacteriales bacterium 44-61]